MTDRSRRGALAALLAAALAASVPAPGDAQDRSTAGANAAQPAPEAAALLAGKPAPAFSLPDQNDKPRALADSKGKWVVLAFYPADRTKG